MNRKYCTFHGGPPTRRVLSLSQAILKIMHDANCELFEVSAWWVAKKIDALGSSVSSMMWKMCQRGQLVRRENQYKTRHGGWHYKLPFSTEYDKSRLPS